MADGQSSEVDAAARQSKQERKKPRITQWVERFVAEVNQLAEEDWKDSDGAVGRLILCDDEGKHTYVYEMKNGKLRASDSTGPFVATITMSVDTFAELFDAALFGMTELTSERKYAPRHIAYEGERRIIDSERFRKIFRRFGSATGARKKVS